MHSLKIHVKYRYTGIAVWIMTISNYMYYDKTNTNLPKLPAYSLLMFN